MLRNICILSSLFGTVVSVCMNDWVRNEGSCYYFAHLPAERVPWQKAVHSCSWNESRLVIVETKAEHEFIKRHLAELNPQAEDQFWTFGNDIVVENTWVWGEVPDRITTTFWHAGEPNQNAGEEDCLAYYTRYNFDWNDEHCERNEYYICEVVDEEVSGIIG